MRIERGFEDPAVSRIATENINGETVLRVPPRRNVFVLAFLLFWLGGWTVGGKMAMDQLWSGTVQGGAQGFLSFWLCAWALGWAAAASTIVRQIFGVEEIGATSTGLRHSYRLLLWSRTRRFNPASIAKLRWQEAGGSQWSRQGTPPSVAFDYGAKTIQMAKGADSGEGEYIVSTLRQRLGLDRGRS